MTTIKLASEPVTSQPTYSVSEPVIDDDKTDYMTATIDDRNGRRAGSITGDGTGASAIAIIDGSGHIIGFVIINYGFRHAVRGLRSDWFRREFYSSHCWWSRRLNYDNKWRLRI